MENYLRKFHCTEKDIFVKFPSKTDALIETSVENCFLLSTFPKISFFFFTN